MDIPWDDARLLLAVFESGSVSGAARALKVTQPTASRKLAELEARLGEPLFERGVSGTSLTAFGEQLVEPARRMAEWAAELARAAERRPGVEGVVRVTAAPGVAHGLLVPFAAELAQREPGIRLQVTSTVRALDLTRREADIALRLGAATEADSVLDIDLELRAFASSSYVRRLGKGFSRQAVDWIGWTPPFEDLSPNRVFRRHLPGTEPAFASDDYILQIHACEMGLGVMLLPRPHPRYRVGSALVELDLRLPPMHRQLSLLCPRSASAIPRVRAVLDHLTTAMCEWVQSGTRLAPAGRRRSRDP
jgi:DNA-binding transcriptional LysR family regulator